MYRIELTHTSKLPVSALYQTLADHDQLGRVLGAPVRRIRDGNTEPNGVGSVRKVGVGPLALEETVTDCQTDEFIEYRITRGGFPLRGHRGRLRFAAAADGGSRVDWTIEYDSALPLAGTVLQRALGTVIGRGLRKLG